MTGDVEIGRRDGWPGERGLEVICFLDSLYVLYCASSGGWLVNGDRCLVIVYIFIWLFCYAFHKCDGDILTLAKPFPCFSRTLRFYDESSIRKPFNSCGNSSIHTGAQLLTNYEKIIYCI